MRTPHLLTLSLITLASSLAVAQPRTDVAKPGSATATSSLAPLGTRDVIEQLKSIRSDIVVEEENVRLLRTRLERAELEDKLSGLSHPKAPEKGQAAAAPRARPTRGPTGPVPESPDAIVVKAVTTSPFKEAIVTYKGRVYTVRPGDTLGTLTIKDITESGVVTGSNTILR